MKPDRDSQYLLCQTAIAGIPAFIEPQLGMDCAHLFIVVSISDIYDVTSFGHIPRNTGLRDGHPSPIYLVTYAEIRMDFLPFYIYFINRDVIGSKQAKNTVTAFDKNLSRAPS